MLRGILKKNKTKKVGIHWRGPLRVVKVMSDFLFEVEDLRSAERSTVHGTRLKFFRNKDFEVTEEVKEYLAFQDEEYCVVHEFEDIRVTQGEVGLKLKWRGFDDEDPGWEAMKIMKEDVPVMVDEFLASS